MSTIIHIFHKTLCVPEDPYFTKVGQFQFDSELFIYSSFSDLLCLLLSFIKSPGEIKTNCPT